MLSDRWSLYLRCKNLKVISSYGVKTPSFPVPNDLPHEEVQDYANKMIEMLSYASATVSLDTKPDDKDFSVVQKYEKHYWVKLTKLDSNQRYFFQE